MSDFITDILYKRQSEETPSKYRELLISSLKSTFRCSRSIFTLSRSSWKLVLLELNERPTIDSTQERWNTTFLLIKASNISWTHGRIEFMLCANLFPWHVSFLEYYWLVLHAVEVSFQLKYFIRPLGIYISSFLSQSSSSSFRSNLYNRMMFEYTCHT